MATREQLQAAAIQCVNYEQQLLNHQSVVQLAIQRLQENAIAIDDLLSKMDDGDSVEWSSLPTITDEIKTLIAFTHQYRPSLRTVLQKLQGAIKKSDITTLNQLLQDERITETDAYPLFQFACNKGNTVIVHRLLQDARFIPAADNKSLIIAIKRHHLEIVDLILKNPSTNPTVWSLTDAISPLTMASSRGLIDIVDRLLQDERVDPSEFNNTAIITAFHYKHFSVIKRLLQDERCNTVDVLHRLMIIASRYGNLTLLEMVLQDERVDPSAEHNHAIHSAIEQGNLAVVERLLQDPRLDPSSTNTDEPTEHGSSVITTAAVNGRISILKRLLLDSRVNPSENANEAIKHAEASGFTEIVELLKLHGCSL